MSQKEEEFPFEEFVQALGDPTDLRKTLKSILSTICQKNIYWTYSAISTIIQILKSKDEEPIIKCRSLQAASILLETCQYPVVVFVELYMVPILLEIANFKGRKSDEAMAYYFQHHQRSEDTEQIRKLSMQFVSRGIELLFWTANIKPNRTVETEQLKQESIFAKTVQTLKERGLEQPKQKKWSNQAKQKQYRKLFLDKLKRFATQSEEWTQFLLVNLLEEVQTGKKDLLELRLLLSFGQSFLTSAIINFCQEELLEITQTLDHKKKYLGILNELVRTGDIQAVIMVKNSDFIPTLVAQINKLPGHQGMGAGQQMFPQIKATKQVKRQFYADFMRCLQTWAICMPQDYDSDDFNIKNIYQYLKKDKKFKFPENMLLVRYQKEIKQNLQKNKERNQRLLDILENMQSSRQQSLSRTARSKVSNVLQKTTLLAPTQLQVKLEDIKKSFRQLTIDQQSANKAFKVLVQFKDNWITYLQSLDFDSADEQKLEMLVNNGQKSVQQIQLVVPIYGSLQKGKLSFKQFRQRVNEALQFHNDVSVSITNNRSGLDKSKSFKASKIAQNKNGKSIITSKIGKSMHDKIKAKSKIGDKTRMNMSKAMDRSNMLQKSRLDKSKNVVMDTSVKRLTDKKQNSQTINFKKGIQRAYHEEDGDESITQNYRIQEGKTKKHITQPVFSPKVNRSTHDEKQTSKKDIKKNIQQDSEQDQKVIRVADYQVEAHPSKKSIRNQRGSSRDRSQNSGSKLLLRRNNSRLDRSNESESRISIGKRSVSGRRIKESSLRKISIEQDKTRKISEPSIQAEEKTKQKPKIEKPQNILAEVEILEGKLPLKTKDKFYQFTQANKQISSIHSNSNVKISHHSSEQILNMTGQISQINYSKQLVKVRDSNQPVVQYATKDFQIAPPLVGDYYEELHKKRPKEEKISRKNNREDSRSSNKSNDNPQFKNIFLKNNDYTDKNDFRLMKKMQKVQGHPKIQSPTISQGEKEFRHSTKNVLSVKEIGAPHTKTSRNSIKDQQVHKSVSSSKLLEMRSIEEQKNKEIMTLQQKIKELETESVTMRKKLALKDSELKSIKSGSQASSQRGFAHFTTASASGFEKSSLRSSSASRRVEMTQFEKQVENNYRQYLERIKGNTFKKSLLKLKCLVHRTDQIQIGCLSQRCDGMLESTLYVTPHRFDMIDFSISVIHDHRLKIKVSPESVKVIQALKQQKVHLLIQVLSVPFCLPEFQINYKADSQYCSSYSRLTLPLGFNKFCSIRALEINNTNKANHKDYVKSDNFKLNTKVVKLQKIMQSFPNFTYLPAIKGREWMMLGATCSFLESEFNLILNVSEKWSWFEGYLLNGETKVMNFLMCTFKEMIDNSKK